MPISSSRKSRDQSQSGCAGADTESQACYYTNSAFRMPRNESPNHKDNADVTQSAIHGIRGTLFLLSIVNDEDDAATLRTDLKRSRLNEYKFQRCTSLDQGCSMLRACAFDVIFLNLEELEVDPIAEYSTTQTSEPIEEVESIEEIAKVETVEQPEPEPPQAKEVKEAPKPTQKTSEALSIDKLSAYEEVMKSVARQKTATSTQESLPFDFAQEPVTDFSPPNPAKEGFISAAKRLVAMTRKEHNLEASISVADQQSIELEQRKDMLFDILRELLINVVRHSRAKLCIITLFRDEDEWVLQVEDDGVGLNDKLKSVNAPLNKIGLFQIRTQLALKGGHLDMVPASPTGLIARVRIPVSIRDGAKSS